MGEGAKGIEFTRVRGGGDGRGGEEGREEGMIDQKQNLHQIGRRKQEQEEERQEINISESSAME